jgi:hypothetical protein
MDPHTPSFRLEDFDLRLNGYHVPETRVETPTVKARRDRQFLPPLPERVFCELVKLPRKAMAVYMVIRLRTKLERSRTVAVTTCFLQRFGLTRKDKYHALPLLERVGLLRIEQPGRGGRNPVVTLREDPRG